ncbi:MAG: polyprenyl synthetase family protein [Saprospiraceae bacterium]|nr:polyprenyl synthetase family protein [Saprospiraceae bacterium]
MQLVSTYYSDFMAYMKANTFDKAPNGLYQPVDYIMQLGGKRLRPILVLMGYRLFHDTHEPALPLALAVEVFHNFSLVHDDIMDDAPLRRGKPTVHELYNVNTGILSGDVMLIKCYEFLLRAPAPLIPALVQIFNEVAIKVCEGQQYDMDFETRDDVTIPSYLKMIEYKTAALIEGSLSLGAILAESGADNCHHLGAFGRNIGLAFQMQDDILDTFGDPAKFGKKVGGDILNNKKTFLLLKAQELASAEDRSALKHWMSKKEFAEAEKIAGVTELFRKYEVLERAAEQMQSYQDQAFKHLEKVGVSSERKQELADLAHELLVREF